MDRQISRKIGEDSHTRAHSVDMQKRIEKDRYRYTVRQRQRQADTQSRTSKKVQEAVGFVTLERQFKTKIWITQSHASDPNTQLSCSITEYKFMRHS